MKIVVTTCDRYAWIIPDFIRAFLRAWPDCPWRVDLVWGRSDARPLAEPWIPNGWSIYATPDVTWAANLLAFLDLGDEPFLLLLEDFILDTVDDKRLRAIAKIFDHAPDVGLVRVHPCPGPTLPWHGTVDPLGVIDKKEPYAISLQATMWRPQVIRDLFRTYENPWQTEIEGSKRAADYDAYTFLGTKESAIGYRELMRRGVEVLETRHWIQSNLSERMP